MVLVKLAELLPKATMMLCSAPAMLLQIRAESERWLHGGGHGRGT